MPGLKGRYETAYGLTDPVDILKGLCQGDLSSPRRASLVMNIPVTRLTRAAVTCTLDKRGMPARFRGGGGQACTTAIL